MPSRTGYTQENRRVRVETPHMDALARVLIDDGATVRTIDGALEVSGLESSRIGELALEHRIVVHELVRQRESLEDAYFRLTEASVDFHGTSDALVGAAQ